MHGIDFDIFTLRPQHTYLHSRGSAPVDCAGGPTPDGCLLEGSPIQPGGPSGDEIELELLHGSGTCHRRIRIDPKSDSLAVRGVCDLHKCGTPRTGGSIGVTFAIRKIASGGNG